MINQMSENKPESLETSDIFALRIEHKNGFVEFPTYVSTDIADWGEYLAEAEHHYKTQYPSAILSTSVGETFTEAGVHTPGTISNWILSRINLVLKPRMEKSQRFLAELEGMQIPRKILNILKEDLDIEGNKLKKIDNLNELVNLVKLNLGRNKTIKKIENLDKLHNLQNLHFISSGIKKIEISNFFKAMNNFDKKINLIKFCNNCFLIYKKE